MSYSPLSRPKSTYTGSELCAMSACEVVDHLGKGSLSPLEVLEASRIRIDETNESINSIVTTCYDRAIDRAQNIDTTSLLCGLPIPIKDLNAVSGVRTTMGTQGLSDFVPSESDALVELLESSGALISGKTNTPEMGAGANTFNTIFGRTCNPWNLTKNAGGSSGGASASLASGQSWLAHGSDLAGSLRTPAAYCGVVGLRPSPGAVLSGTKTLGFSNEATSGPMARNVSDCALLLDAMSSYDSRSPLSLPSPLISYQESVKHAESTTRHTIKIAYAPNLNGFSPVEEEIESIMHHALNESAKDGAIIEDACPNLDGLYETYITLRALFWASTAGRLPTNIQSHFKQALKDNIDLGRSLTIDKIIDANLTRTQLYHSLRTFLTDYDVLACAVVGLEPQPIEIEYPTSVAGVEMLDYMDWLRFSFLATTAGLPAISLPVGFTKSGLPVGIQLIGPPRGDALVLSVARSIELSLNLDHRPIDPIESVI